MEKIPGIITNGEKERNVSQANERVGYSRRLDSFKPVDIEILVSLSDINPSILDFEDSDIARGSVCQMVVDPAGAISIGYFSPQGSGRCYYQMDKSDPLKEGEHFKFV